MEERSFRPPVCEFCGMRTRSLMHPYRCDCRDQPRPTPAEFDRLIREEDVAEVDR